MCSTSKNSFRLLIALIIISLQSACGTTTKRVSIDPVAAAREEMKQKVLYVETQDAGQERVQRLTYPMLKYAAPICDDEIRPSLGFIPVNKYAWPIDYQDDVLITIAGKKVPSGKNATERTWKLIEKQASIDVPIEVTVDRGTQILTYEITPIAVCDTYAFLIGGSEVNAYADGQGIYITLGMLRFVQNDMELATVIAHELAHNAMEHTNKKTTNLILVAHNGEGEV